MPTNLAKLELVDLREGWPHEALDFTRWLATPENLQLLSDEVGIDLRVLQTEASVGSFSVDILAEDQENGQKVIIENQLEDTDHDHLGKLITYASGVDAKAIIWVVREAREEHEKAIEWLNEKTIDEIGFFLVKVELLRIGNSMPAPRITTICGPNGWAKAVRLGGIGDGNLSETKISQLAFWEGFRSFCEKNGKKEIASRKHNGRSWYNVRVGTSMAHISLTVNSKEDSIGCEIYIPHNKNFYRHVLERKEEVERAIKNYSDPTESAVEWYDKEAGKACRIRVVRNVESIFSDSDKDIHFRWLLEKTEQFKKMIRPIVDTYKI